MDKVNTKVKPLFQQIWHGASEDLCQKFKPGSVDLVLADPPFGVNNLSNQAVTQAGKANARKIANDETPEIAIACFKRVMNALLPKTADSCDAYIFTSYQVLKEWLIMLDGFMPQHGFKRSSVIIWEKDGPGMGDLNNPWGMGSEFIMYFQKNPRDKTAPRRNSVLHVPQVRPDKLLHPHEKPLALLEKLITTSTDKRDFVVDPFGGSGSAARAAKNCDRSAVCIEYDLFNYELAKKALEEGESGLW